MSENYVNLSFVLRFNFDVKFISVFFVVDRNAIFFMKGNRYKNQFQMLTWKITT